MNQLHDHCILSIAQFLNPFHLFSFAKTCKKLYYLIILNNYLWYNHCILSTNHSNAKNYIKKLSPSSYFDFYKNTCLPFAHLLGINSNLTLFRYLLISYQIGYWHSDYSFFIGDLISIQFTPPNHPLSKSSKIIIERIKPPHVDIDILQSNSTTLSNPNTTLFYLPTETIKSQLIMYIDLQNNYICQCHHSIHQGIINKFNPNQDTNSLQFTKQLDISDRIKNHDLPMGFPDQFTGIWSYMTHYGSDQTLTSPTISLQSIPETPTIITINCTNNTNLKKLYNHDHEIIQYQPKLSRIVSHHSITKLKQGIWMGLYGIHGIEWIHSYHCPLQNMYIFTKLTGDLNVPRGTISFTFPPHSPTPSTYPELASATVYTGQGTIAMEGYQSPRHIPCQIFVMSESSLFVHWFGLDDSQDTWINEFKFYST